MQGRSCLAGSSGSCSAGEPYRSPSDDGASSSTQPSCSHHCVEHRLPLCGGERVGEGWRREEGRREGGREEVEGSKK